MDKWEAETKPFRDKIKNAIQEKIEQFL